MPLGITTDIRGLPRFVDDPLAPDTGIGFPTVDLGAYELQPPGLPPSLRKKRTTPNVPVPIAPPRVTR